MTIVGEKHMLYPGTTPCTGVYDLRIEVLAIKESDNQLFFFSKTS
jgi:hypothetical protein